MGLWLVLFVNSEHAQQVQRLNVRDLKDSFKNRTMRSSQKKKRDRERGSKRERKRERERENMRL